MVSGLVQIQVALVFPIFFSPVYPHQPVAQRVVVQIDDEGLEAAPDESLFLLLAVVYHAGILEPLLLEPLLAFIAADSLCHVIRYDWVIKQDGQQNVQQQ